MVRPLMKSSLYLLGHDDVDTMLPLPPAAMPAPAAPAPVAPEEGEMMGEPEAPAGTIPFAAAEGAESAAAQPGASANG